MIYVIDSGILASHDEFMTATGSRVIGGVDLLANEPGGGMPCEGNWAIAPCTDFPYGVMIDGHGTAVASVAAGNRVGVAPGAKLFSIRALGFIRFTPARFDAALDAVIRHAWDPSAPPFRTAVVTMSFGLYEFDAGIDAKIGVGDIHVAAEGVGPDDGFTGYKPTASNGTRPRWGDYGAAASDGDSIWIASEYVNPMISRYSLSRWLWDNRNMTSRQTMKFPPS